MRFTITPLGSAGGRTVGQVVDDIVRYLEPRLSEVSAQAPPVPGGDGPSSYYADRGTEPGRWVGFGAGEAGLRGPVVPSEFARVLAGRDPRTGSRLITAQGSAGRRPTLGAGTETRWAADGTALYSVADAATALRVSRREVEAMMAAGERVAIGLLIATLTGQPSPVTEPPGSYLVARVDADGTRWTTDADIDRVEEARARGIAPDEVNAAGDPGDLLTLSHAARLGGVTAQYLRSLCRRFEKHRDDIETTLAEGGRPRRAYVVAYRGTKAQWLVRRRDLVEFMERRVAPAVRVGYDLTLTTEKSLGVLALLGDQRTRTAVLDAIEAGNDSGLAYLEHHAASARRKGEPVGVRGLTVASFRHLTSRALDPFPHHHNVIANTVVDELGTRRALDARGLYRHAQEASALATAEMRYQLSKRLGVRWRPGRAGGWEIDGIADELVREFSRRRSEIDDAIAELEEAIGRRTTLDEVQSIVSSTRPAKERVDPSQLVAGWLERAKAHGLTHEGVAGCTGHEQPQQLLDREAIFAALSDPATGLCANASIFTRSDALSALVDLPVPTQSGIPQPLILPAVHLERLADEFLASRHVIPLRPASISSGSILGQRELFTTPEMLDVQQRIITRYAAGRSAGVAAVPDEACEAALMSAPHLTREQQGLVRSFCTSGHRIQCAVGRAGAGKTSSMRSAVAAWRAAGYRVVGAAVKGEAARHLAAGAGVTTETVAWYLARTASTTLPLDDRTVLIVDEASTLSDRDLDALLVVAERTGTAVRLIGDPDQHGAVTAGGMFRHLCEQPDADAPELAETHRLTDPVERRVVDLLRRGHTDDALGLLEAAGRLHVAEDDLSLYVGMLQRWWQAHLAGDHHPMVDRRHHTRRRLNRLARQLLRANGELGPDELEASGDRALAAGDRVVARMAARHLHVAGNASAYVHNGAAGTVISVQRGRIPAADRIRVDFDGIGAIDIPRQFFDEHEGPGGRRDVGIDHAYAVTSYAVQGATYASSTSRIDENATRAEAYVDLTRGRTANHLFLTRAMDPLDGEHLPKVPPPPIPDNVARRLKASGPERAAIEVDPLAAKLNAQPGTQIVDAATAERTRAVTAERAARLARHDPPPDLVGQLPGRSTVPHLAKLWGDTVAGIAGYRASWSIEPGEGEFGWAVGPPVPGAEEGRQGVIEQVISLTVASAAEELRSHGWSTLPSWAQDYLAQRAAAGACSIDAGQASALFASVRQYREARGLNDDDTSGGGNLIETMLGAPPTGPLDRATYRLLGEELLQSTPPPTMPERGIA
jgi:conjugative relaxase-like TrwC/TraI family protein